MRIVYFDMDSCRPDHLSCYGYQQATGRATSPNIDRIAAEGVVFTNCYASDAPCLPSRTALFSGRFGIKNGVVGHGGTAARMRYPGDGHMTNPDLLPLPMALSRAGVRTITFTTFAQRHLAWHFYAGWDEIQKHSNTNGREIAAEVNAAVLPWLKARGREEHYFLHINYWDPHTPYRAPLEYGNPFEGLPAPAWPDEETIHRHWESYGPMSARDQPERRTAFPRMPAEIATRADFIRWIDGYDTAIRYMDDYIGQVLETLDSLGVLEETAVIFSADHGENQGELNIYGDHQTADHPTCRVPLIVRWPGVTKPGRCDALIYQLDLAPTLCELLGVPVPRRWDGRSFATALRGEPFEGRPFLVLGQGAWTCQRAVRTGNWLCLRTYHPGHHPFEPVMLFDLEQDPYETTDLAGSRPDAVAACDRLLMDWWQRCLSGPDAAPDPMLTVMQEGGPWYVRNRLEAFLERLRTTGRQWAVEDLLRRLGQARS